MFPSAPGSAVIVTWLPEATADSTTGPLATQSVALICVAILAQTISGVTFVRVAGADPSELDTDTGPVIGTLTVKATGGLGKWKAESCRVRGAEGVHDLYLKFTGGGGPLLNFDWWKFERK